jgi:hypothetical protein
MLLAIIDPLHDAAGAPRDQLAILEKWVGTQHVRIWSADD